MSNLVEHPKTETHSEGTMFKVFCILSNVGHTDQQVVDIINSMQNAGILFRERA